MGFPGPEATGGFDRDKFLDAAVFFIRNAAPADGWDAVWERAFRAPGTGDFFAVIAGPLAAGFGAAVFFAGGAAFGAGALGICRETLETGVPADFTVGLAGALAAFLDETEPETVEVLAATRGAAEFFLPALFSIRIPSFHLKILWFQSTRFWLINIIFS
jgi:hypothetical protein